MTQTTPALQQTAEIVEPGENFRIVLRSGVPVPEPGNNEVLVKLNCTGLCHSEVRAVLGWGAYNSIIGHEGIGTVNKAGPGVSPSLLGRRVGVKWLYSACNECSVCKRGFPHYCANQRNTGRHVPGTLQQYVIADARFVTIIPDGLSDHIAAPLLCAGLTMAGALSRLENVVRPGEFVVISGSGGGLGHIGVQIAARTKKLRVIAVDTGEEKRQLSLASGAEAFIDFRTEDVAARVQELTGEGAHAAIVVPGEKEAFAMAPNVVRNLGYIVCVGLPPNDVHLPISATLCAARGISIIGSSVGSEDQMTELLQQAMTGKISPSIRVLDFSDASMLIHDLKNDAITGKVVVRIPQQGEE